MMDALSKDCPSSLLLYAFPTLTGGQSSRLMRQHVNLASWMHLSFFQEYGNILGANEGRTTI